MKWIIDLKIFSEALDYCKTNKRLRKKGRACLSASSLSPTLTSSLDPLGATAFNLKQLSHRKGPFSILEFGIQGIIQ